ncbi:unnamed protein product [Medioppia subpectinata]|uniref:Protein PTHB1 n=1 Tax=Medioppia subpectinata TaxID=1979941 RepID=A0A7R9L0V4_9ACAR|nr:unnamed protein product [Medioppia subpectinata]CAG2113419.1 unnamed protein product [Medioppia subpectinata]
MLTIIDWWSVPSAGGEQFGHYSLCVANIDNSIGGSDKIIVGNLNGLLRLYNVGSNPTEEGLPAFAANDLLMEMDFKIPILQISTGLLLSATTNIQLAVLHPKKLSIYSISSTAGVTEHGSAYNILLIYEHLLQRSAFTMTLGPFGHIRGKDFLCVQSLDGNLVFYEQESLAFNRFLPNSLLPGAMAYIAHSDSFIVATSLWTIESYRYQVLAIANTDDNTNSGQTKGRKVTPDWSLSLGESVIDLKVVLLEKSNHYIVVLGERNLYLLKENGSIWVMKKLEFSPSCMTAYSNDTNDAIISLIATNISTLIIYSNDRAMWATQLPFTPIAIQRAFFPNLLGAVICLSDDGSICCGYLGTNPSIKIVSVPNSHVITQSNYSESESELQELRTIINSHNLEGNTVDTKVVRNDLMITICDVQTISGVMSSKTSNPLFQISIQLQTTSTLFVASTKVDLIVSYTNEDGAPRVVSKSIHIPINIFSKLCSPLKEVEHKVSFDTITSGQPINLAEIFSDMFDTNNNNTSAVGFEIYDDHYIVSIYTSINKSMNQKFVILSESLGGMAFIANELIRRLAKNSVKYDVSNLDISFIPLANLFALIDDHLMARHHVMNLQTCLANSATQFRAIQKRLLIKLKDRNPTPLNNLETLLKVSQTQINAYSESLLKATTDLHNKNSHLSSGWEERTELCLHTVLESYGKDGPKMNEQLAIPDTSDTIKRLINILVNRIFKGETINNRDTSRETKGNRNFKQNSIINEEEEYNELTGDE